jgi:hypothetical protein
MSLSIPLATLRHRRPSWLIGLLVLTLLGPGLVPVQGHTRVVQTLDGRLQTICTWHDHAKQDSPEPWQSPAYVYAQLMGGAANGDIPTLFISEHFQPAYQAAPVLRDPGLAAPQHYAIRAPPLRTC